jgi:hypothetical protein
LTLHNDTSESIEALARIDYLQKQASTVLSEMLSNENATEHVIPSLCLILLLAVKCTHSGTVSGLKELWAGGSGHFLFGLSAAWSVRSIILGHVQQKTVEKNSFMSTRVTLMHWDSLTC